MRSLLSKYSKDELKKIIQSGINNGLTTTEISQQLGVDRSTVNRWQRKFGIKPVKRKLKRMPISDQELKQRYLSKFHNASALAESLGVSTDSVMMHLKTAGIDNPLRSDPDHVGRKVLTQRYTVEELRNIMTDLYDQGFNNDEVARKLNSTVRTISRWKAKFGLQIKPFPISNEELKQQYLDGHSANFLANKYGYSVDTVIRHLNAIGIHTDRTYGMKVARHRMHDSLWNSIKQDLDNGCYKQDIVAKYHITMPNLNLLLERKDYTPSYLTDISDVKVALIKYQRSGNRKLVSYLKALIEYTEKYNSRPKGTDLDRYLGISEGRTTSILRDYGLSDLLLPAYFDSYLVRKTVHALDALGVKYVRNVRTLIAPYEIDFWLPEYHLGFEINPASTHSINSGFAEPHNADYHQKKSMLCLEKGIKLVHVFDWTPISKEAFKCLLVVASHPNLDGSPINLNTLLVTKQDIDNAGFKIDHIAKPVLHYVDPDSHRVLKRARSNRTRQVYDAGVMYLAKK